MEFRYLAYFCAVARTKNFTRAAAECSVAQSALSQQIGRLERELGSKLFYRTSREVRLTEAGEVLLPLAERILADVDHARGEVNSLAGLERGRVRLGLILSPASAIDLIGVIGQFHQRYPQIEFEITHAASEALVVDVLRGLIDIAVVGLHPSDITDTVTRSLLASDRLVAVVSSRHHLADRDTVSLAELAKTGQFIHFGRTSGVRRYVEEALSRAGVTITSSLEMNELRDMVRLASLDVGVTVVPRSTVSDRETLGFDRDSYRVIALDDPDARHPISVIHDPERFSAAAQAFREVLVEAATAGA